MSLLRVGLSFKTSLLPVREALYFAPAPARREKMPVEQADRHLRAVEELFLLEGGPISGGRYPGAVAGEDPCPEDRRSG